MCRGSGKNDRSSSRACPGTQPASRPGSDSRPTCGAPRLSSGGLAVGRGSALVYLVFVLWNILLWEHPALIPSPTDRHLDCLVCVAVQGRTSLYKIRVSLCDNVICEGTNRSSDDTDAVLIPRTTFSYSNTYTSHPDVQMAAQILNLLVLLLLWLLEQMYYLYRNLRMLKLHI